VRRTRILVADPLRIFRSGVRNLLARESDFEVVEARSLDEVAQVIDDGCPDIALVDLGLPPAAGVAAVFQIGDRAGAYLTAWTLAIASSAARRAS